MTTMTAQQTANDVRVMAGCNDVLAVGRIALAVIFVMSGLTKFMDLSATAGAVASKGLPMPMVFAASATAAELVGGLLISIGWQTRLAALTLVIFTLITITSSTASGTWKVRRARAT